MRMLARIIGIVSAGMLLSAQAQAIGAFADIVVLVDESGSMSAEHAWIGSTILSLEAELAAAGVGTGVDANRYQLVGFGGTSSHVLGHDHGGFTNAFDFNAETSTLTLAGATEDGYDAIDHALGLGIRAGASFNIILITDEDRDNAGNTLNFTNILAAMNAQDAILNVVVNNPFFESDGTTAAIGVDSDGFAYTKDGSGGFTTSVGGIVGNGVGTTEIDYVPLALATNGAAWNLNDLRAGGFTADSFTAAFIEIKVAEIIEDVNPIPEPTAGLTFGVGLLITAAAIRRRAA